MMTTSTWSATGYTAGGPERGANGRQSRTGASSARFERWSAGDANRSSGIRPPALTLVRTHEFFYRTWATHPDVLRPKSLRGASVVVGVSNAPNWEDAAVLEFFVTSIRNLLTREAAVAGVGHHVALSVVGSDSMTESGYFRAKIAQEELVRCDLVARNDPRQVVTDPPSRYNGVEVSERTLIPGMTRNSMKRMLRTGSCRRRVKVQRPADRSGGARSLSVFRAASLNGRQPHLRLGRHL
jgi:hypothetical protein